MALRFEPVAEAAELTFTLVDGVSGEIFCRDVDRVTGQRVMQRLRPDQLRRVKQLIAHRQEGIQPEIFEKNILAPDRFVVMGQWVDREYVDLQQAVTTRPATREELARIMAGPRRHPYGPEAVERNVDGMWVVYPNQEAAGA